MEGITLPSFLCFYHQKVERRAHLCTSTYRVLVHFYLFTEGYFQYTVVQLYFVEIWYIEHIEECWKRISIQVDEMKKEAMLVAQIMITPPCFLFFR